MVMWWELYYKVFESCMFLLWKILGFLGFLGDLFWMRVIELVS